MKTREYIVPVLTLDKEYKIIVAALSVSQNLVNWFLCVEGDQIDNHVVALINKTNINKTIHKILKNTPRLVYEDINETYCYVKFTVPEYVNIANFVKGKYSEIYPKDFDFSIFDRRTRMILKLEESYKKSLAQKYNVSVDMITELDSIPELKDEVLIKSQCQNANPLIQL